MCRFLIYEDVVCECTREDCIHNSLEPGSSVDIVHSWHHSQVRMWDYCGPFMAIMQRADEAPLDQRAAAQDRCWNTTYAAHREFGDVAPACPRGPLETVRLTSGWVCLSCKQFAEMN